MNGFRIFFFSMFYIYTFSIRYVTWCCARLVNPTDQIIPSWTGFNILLREDIAVVQSKVGYLDSINNPATEIGTVYVMLKRCDNIRRKLNLSSIVCVLDQAMYAKACEVKFKKKEEFLNVVLSLGTFHTLMMIVGVAGKRYSAAGF